MYNQPGDVETSNLKLAATYRGIRLIQPIVRGRHSVSILKKLHVAFLVDLKIACGIDNLLKLDRSYFELEIKEIHVHPKFDFKIGATGGHDIAVYILQASGLRMAVLECKNGMGDFIHT